MAKFGAFQVNQACRHAYVNLEMDLEPGRFEPQSMEEFEAMEHLAAVPPLPDAEGEPFAVKLEDPDVPAPEADMATPVEEPALAEPPAPTPPKAAEPPAASPPAASAPADKE